MRDPNSKDKVHRCDASKDSKSNAVAARLTVLATVEGHLVPETAQERQPTTLGLRNSVVTGRKQAYSV